MYMAEIDLVIWLSQPDIKTNTLSNVGGISNFIHKFFGKVEKLFFNHYSCYSNCNYILYYIYVCLWQIFIFLCYRYALTIANIHWYCLRIHDTILYSILQKFLNTLIFNGKTKKFWKRLSRSPPNYPELIILLSVNIYHQLRKFSEFCSYYGNLKFPKLTLP